MAGMDIPEITAADAATRLAAGGTLFMDVRDGGSYAASHIPGALHVDDASIEAFLEETGRAQPVVVYCYHGHASRGGAAYLMQHGFTQVWSLEGGFEGWRGVHPEEGAAAARLSSRPAPASRDKPPAPSPGDR